MSRAAWLAFGSTAMAAAGIALAACSSDGDPTGTTGGKEQGADSGPVDAGPVDAGPIEAAVEAGPVEAGSDAGPVDGAVDPGQGRFLCSDGWTRCRVGLEFCLVAYVAPFCTGSPKCEPLDAEPYTSACAATPTCDCINTKLSPDLDGHIFCSELAPLDLEISDNRPYGCGGCYGCPPARLERLRGAVG
jgi:hypothetical protein